LTGFPGRGEKGQWGLLLPVVRNAKTIYVGIPERVSQYLGPPLFVLVLMRHAVDLEAVALQRAALGEGFLAQVALVRPHACTGVTVYIQYIRWQGVQYTRAAALQHRLLFPFFPSTKAGSNHQGM
jgi:hypothetical protein